MTILVTGGAGYIGSHCVAALLAAGRAVVALDNGSVGNIPWSQSVLSKATWVQADLLNTDRLVEILTTHSITAVMHFAASCLVGESFEHPRHYYENNVMGSRSLLEAMREASVPRLIVSSTCAVYGRPQYLPLDEAHPLAPINPYGWTKQVMEHAFIAASKSHPMQCVMLRYFNAAGAHLTLSLGEIHQQETHLIPLLLQVASGRQTQPLSILGTSYDTPDGTCLRDYIHVCDLVNAHLLALQNLEQRADAAGTLESYSEIYNLGSEKGYSVREIVTMAEALTGQIIPTVDHPPRPGDPPVLIANSSKIRQALNWQPAYSEMETILKTAWVWEQYVQQKGFFQLSTVL